VVTLAIDIVAALAGAFGAGLVAVRLTRRLAQRPRGRIARRVVALLSGLAGAEIATQLVELVQQLELDGEKGRVFKGTSGPFDAVDFAIAFREILFSGALLLGLAALVGVAATRKYGDTSA
jgi:acyl-CoA synthetase (AMP-forming)/AMP-acid ligase II